MIKEAPFGFPRVAGFGDGRRAAEYYYSQSLQQSQFGLSTGYNISKLVDSSDLSGMTNIKWFADASGKVYAVDSNGRLFKEQNPGSATSPRSEIPAPATAAKGSWAINRGGCSTSEPR